MKCGHVWIAVLCIVLPGVSCLPDSPKLTYEELYKAGVDAYLEERWYECVASIERALEDYFYYRTSVVHCRARCKSNYDASSSSPSSIDDKDGIYVDVFAMLARDALCLMKCEKSAFRERPPTLNKETINDFENKVPYDYLQLCYFKIGDVQKAASCAYTFLVHNPKHEVMHNNLKYYLDQPKVQIQKVKYLEAKDYQELYMEAAKAYNEEKWNDVITLMEKAVKKYLKAEEECRLLCEGMAPAVSDPNFIVNSANHFAYSLRCKQSCPDKLAYMYGQKQDNFFDSHFHYLQYAYYKTNQLEKACEAVGSFLSLRPNDLIMLENKGYYLEMDKVEENWFSPRPEIQSYLKRKKKEAAFLNFIEDSFNFPILLEEAEFSGSMMQDNIHSNHKKIHNHTPEEFEDYSLLHGIHVVQKDEELNGSLRFMADGFATADECSKLVTLAQEGAVHGDGYNGKQSPHTEFEKFEGLTVGRAVTLTEKGILNGSSTQLLLNVSEKARTFVEMYFNLSSKLYFAYTHLVCRTALPGSPDSRSDLSHPVHADNCLLLNSGECVKEQPAYVWRDYSAIVYLNEDFEGGEFIFARDKNTVQAQVKPRCGRMVAFSAGKENLHGVQAVVRGKRCALAMWFTLDPHHQERERLFAEQVLTDVVQNKKQRRDDEKDGKTGSRGSSCASCSSDEILKNLDPVTIKEKSNNDVFRILDEL